MGIDLDQELAQKAISARERLFIKLLLLAIEFIAPTKYSHQLDKTLDAIREDLKK